MENNNILNLDSLTAARKLQLSEALEGHSVDLLGGQFTDESRASLNTLGITATEITALEQNNNSEEARATFKIPASNIFDVANNPFSKKRWNLDAQRHLHETDPKEAKNLMYEAGLLK